MEDDSEGRSLWGELSRRRIATKSLARWCRMLAGYLSAGKRLTDAMEILAKRGPSDSRGFSDYLARRLRSGDSLTKAIRKADQSVPPIFLAMTEVAAKTGRLPEVLKELERYFQLQLSMRRRFLSRIIWPVLQLLSAIFIIAVLILILGIIAEMQNAQAIDIVGLGLQGPSGAAIWLALCFGSAAIGYGTFWYLRRMLGQANRIDRLLLKIPVLGPCFRTLALARLCLSMNMTMDSSMPAHQAMRLSLVSTENGAYRSLADRVAQEIRNGQTISVSIAKYDVFPEDFLDILESAEESGEVPEAMLRLGRQYDEQAEHQMALVTMVAGWGVWAGVALLIIYFVVRIFIVCYWQPLQQALEEF
ncbi:Putative type II secretion system protein F [Planctomycetes bacterium Pan216]|uniref:Type II secretion system protein F n=1 Tax=Kolteria novifilia TaxID=2527975 RepID=A0A518BBW8_9BACT|nr:Putative type II secretion system protein F [Planctomycetes bacterium Pan216]